MVPVRLPLSLTARVRLERPRRAQRRPLDSLGRIAWAVSVAALAGCAALGYRDAAHELARFERLAAMPQVRYPEGAEPLAERVAALLPAAIAKVEAAHYRPFRRPPDVYVCDTEACFHRFVSPSSNFAAAVVYANHLVLSPRLFSRERRRLEPILIHELSHVHLGQARGHYTTAIPLWFHEGLAALAADGGGADLASDEDAWRAAESGRFFLPDEQHLPWERKRADAWDLSIHVFYRQAFVFLRDLRAREPQAFRQLLDALYDQGDPDFDAAFAQAMHANPARSGLAYFKRLHCATAENDDPGCGRHRPSH